MEKITYKNLNDFINKELKKSGMKKNNLNIFKIIEMLKNSGLDLDYIQENKFYEIKENETYVFKI